MMEGLDKEWIYRDNKRIAAYTNIDPGHYVFRVKACNNDGVWNNEGIAIEITIKPPFYRTWWFYRFECSGNYIVDFRVHPHSDQYTGKAKCGPGRKSKSTNVGNCRIRTLS